MGTSAGERLFARYAYPPNELGYCGPDGADVLLSAAGGGTADVRTRAEQFDGAWVYLRIIAAAVGIDDPLDERVVEAYWIGNELLEKVDIGPFGSTVRSALGGEVGADWRTLERRDPAPVPHHSFQVFAVYPWVGLLGRGDTARHVLDQCRIRTGTIESAAGEFVEVSYRPLTWDGGELGLGEPIRERVRWSSAGQALAEAPEPGELVALHWDWVCDRLSAEQAEACERFTLRQLELTNSLTSARVSLGAR